jgi:hypothetical protein
MHTYMYGKLRILTFTSLDFFFLQALSLSQLIQNIG